MCHEDAKRPDGMTLTPWAGGRALLWDFTCTDTLAFLKQNIASVGSGRAACFAEEQKRRKYSSLIPTYQFPPYALKPWVHGVNQPRSYLMYRDPHMIGLWRSKITFVFDPEVGDQSSERERCIRDANTSIKQGTGLRCVSYQPYNNTGMLCF